MKSADVNFSNIGPQLTIAFAVLIALILEATAFSYGNFILPVSKQIDLLARTSK